ncbi:hypothetical protein AVEN_227173-1 [Araneus ventricosus]|uniref:Uncharacterized protein n=1 Tax=Araneus ventricosus TaxID=182803 RepID=A0A4Y2BVJ0_ARAVE|nr:hypothetical protein AVEN_227173-1 [Araneus ventricosus]
MVSSNIFSTEEEVYRPGVSKISMGQTLSHCSGVEIYGGMSIWSTWFTLLKLRGLSQNTPRDFVVNCDKTSHASEPGIKPAFVGLEGKCNNHYTGRGYTGWDRQFIKSFPTTILREWFPKRFARKCFREQAMESEMATFPQPSLLSGQGFLSVLK